MDRRAGIRKLAPGAPALTMAAVLVLALPARAQQVTGTPGSADATTTVSAGKHTIVFDFKYDGPGPGKGGTGVLSVDGKEAARKTIPHTIPLLMAIYETFDVGLDTRTPVDFTYQLPFRFTGTIDKLTFNLGPIHLSEAEKKTAGKAIAIAKDWPRLKTTQEITQWARIISPSAFL